jgi:leader peptidase (prepilin peptidase)/N-methyltransferase
MTNVLPGIFAFVLGACIGSFLNVCISRWPAGLSVISPPSRCPNCERPIQPHENVPIFGWVALRGRCAGCALPISPQYPLVELLVALVWLASVVVYGPTFAAVRVAVFVTILFGIAITDAKHYEIPDGFTVFGFIWVIVTAFAGLLMRKVTVFAGFEGALFGACTGAGAIAIARWLGEVAFQKEAMGEGDITLMAVIGAAVGPMRAVATIFIGAALAVLVYTAVVVPLSRRRSRSGAEEDAGPPLVPFGVFLAPAAVIALLFGESLIAWYASRFLSV